MFILDFDDTLFDTQALKNILAQGAAEPDEETLKQLLFSETPAFLERLQSAGHKLVLLTFGEQKFQNKKIAAAGIKNFFDKIVITAADKEAVLPDILHEFIAEKEIWFVNDKIEETKKIIALFPQLKPVLKMSPRFLAEEYGASAMPYFLTLGQIQQYVEQRTQ